MERAAAVLRAVAAATGSAATASALAATVGLNRTTTWRILATLEGERLVSFDADTGTYSLGFGLIDLAGQADGVTLARSARVVLQRLAAEARETAALAVVRGGALTYVAEATADTVVAAGWQGREVALHATSTGKVLLAFSHPAELRPLLRLPHGQRLPRYTPSTVTSLSRLEEELAVTRERGYAVCRGEFESTAWGVSAPVLDLAGHPVAVVSVWGPSERLGEDRFADLGALAIGGAAEIAGRRTSG
ncbi:IclR family transcriptional regulator [Nocardioides eburneiflavus]|uniref:IclR family transcriptional regulator n=1 Tax=Nocardioides eburneiflavus TaxID=2518372 RepID=UPI00143DCE07|nr:IclR family transcriptional regulator [Nocardioides eburneiflavus]